MIEETTDIQKKVIERWNKTPGVCLWCDAPRGKKVNLAFLGNGRKLLGGQFYSFGRHKNKRVQPLQHHKVWLNYVTVFYILINILQEKGTTTTTSTRYHPTLRDHSLFVWSVLCFSLSFDLWLNSVKMLFTKRRTPSWIVTASMIVVYCVLLDSRNKLELTEDWLCLCSVWMIFVAEAD